MGICASDTSVEVAKEDHSYDDDLGDTGYASSRRARPKATAETAKAKADETSGAEGTSSNGGNKKNQHFEASARKMRDELERRSSVSIDGHITQATTELDLSHDRDEFGNVGFLAEKDLAVLTRIPDTVFLKTSLTVLTLKKNEIEELPEAVSSLVNLTSLNVSENQLVELPHGIGDLVNLEHLNISENKIKKIPPSIGNLQKLTHFLLFKNEVLKFPDEIGKCVAVQELNAFNNKLIKLPKSMGEMVGLIELNVASNKLKTLPKLDKLVNLERLACMWNGLIVLPPIGELPKCAQIQLYSNPFDNITFQGLESLEELDMNKTFVTEIPVGLKGLPNLLRLNMRKCKLKMIPDWVGEIPKLEMLNVGENAIDAVPASLGDAPAMKYLLLDGNAMLNELPDSLTKLNLIRVDIRKTSVPLDSSTVDSLRSKCFSNNGWLKPEAL